MRRLTWVFCCLHMALTGFLMTLLKCFKLSLCFIHLFFSKHFFLLTQNTCIIQTSCGSKSSLLLCQNWLSQNYRKNPKTSDTRENGWNHPKLLTIKWAESWENLFMPYVNSKGTDQPAHPSLYLTSVAAQAVCVLPGRKPRRQVFSWRGSQSRPWSVWKELSDLGLHYLPRTICQKISNHYVIIAV